MKLHGIEIDGIIYVGISKNELIEREMTMPPGSKVVEVRAMNSLNTALFKMKTSCSYILRCINEIEDES